VAHSSTLNPAFLLGNTLSEEIRRLEEFVVLLKREQELLTRGDIEALLPLTENKTSLTNQLAALAQAREGQLERLGLARGRVGMEAWLASSGEDNTKAWQKLLDLATEARGLNVSNGKLIGLHLQHNQQAFAILMTATNRAMNYGPDGQPQAQLGGRILGKA